MESQEGKLEKIKRLVEQGRRLYVQELSVQIPLLEEALQSLPQDFSWERADQIYRIVHKIKGSAPIFGLVCTGKIAESIAQLWKWTQEDANTEQQIEEAMLEQTESLLIDLKIEYEIAKKEIEWDEQEKERNAAPPEQSARLLLIDDDDLLRGYLVGQFRLARYEVDEAADVETAKKLLRENDYDVITLDLMMYPKSGYELFEFLKEDQTLKWIPLIVLSGREDIADKVRCLRLGADDYVTKPFQYEELEARIESLLRRAKQFEQYAFRDALTGVYNRRYFDHQMLVELQWAKRDQTPLSLAFLDIDHFKRINDRYGHQVGDLVLQSLGRLLQHHLRGTDILARYGGEELVVLFPDTTEQQAALAMQRILRRVSQSPLLETEHEAIAITFSAGVAQWSDDLTPVQWVQQADAAMYRAKQQGRNCVVVFGECVES